MVLYMVSMLLVSTTSVTTNPSSCAQRGTEKTRGELSVRQIGIWKCFKCCGLHRYGPATDCGADGWQKPIQERSCGGQQVCRCQDAVKIFTGLRQTDHSSVSSLQEQVSPQQRSLWTRHLALTNVILLPEHHPSSQHRLSLLCQR